MENKKLNIIVENCPQNHKCPAVNVCPVGALSTERRASVKTFTGYFS